MRAPTTGSGRQGAFTAPSRLYLDHAATTPVLPCARAAMAEAAAHWANPSSPHAEGRMARAALEDLRSRAKAALDWAGELIFTGGATDAIAIALTRATGRRVLAGATEHQAVLRHAPAEGLLPVDATGHLRKDVLAERIGGGTPAVVAIQHANNLTGIVQPIDLLAPLVRDAGGVLFVDAAQTAGKLVLPAAADMVAVSAHKFGGPPGVGALLLRGLSLLDPSGGQERGYRAGTENIPGIAGMVAALEEDRGWLARMPALRARLDAAIAAAGGEVIGTATQRLPTIASYRMPGVSAQVQQMRFDMGGVALSATSACSTGAVAANLVLEAMGRSREEGNQAIRIAFGRDTDEDAVDRVAALWAEIAGGARG